jgi:lipopolysaccharide assembly protein B
MSGWEVESLDPSTLVTLLGVTAASALVALVMVLSRKGRTEDRARAYLAGFTYVLSDDPDAAIAELSRAAQLSTETLETYFALGALFRRKGDLERAIRLHQNILLRPGLGPEVKRRAQLALAQDYRRSGLRDKAEEVLTRVLQEEPDNPEALVRLRALREEAGDWEGAAELEARRVRRNGSDASVLAHLLAAHARSIAPRSLAEAEACARRATELDPDCADAHLALCEALAAASRTAEALAPLERALSLQPELAPRVVSQLGGTLGEEEAARLLRAHAAGEGDGAPAYALALARWHQGRGQDDEALALLRRVLEHRPWFWEARRELGSLLLAHGRTEELRNEYRELLATLGAPVMGFSCSACRAPLPDFAFRCPSCESWDTVRREVGATRETGEQRI